MIGTVRIADPMNRRSMSCTMCAPCPACASGACVCPTWPAPRTGRMFVLDDRSTRGAPSDPRPTLHHRARSRGGRHGHGVRRARPEARPPRRAQGAEARARRAARRRAVPERNPRHRTPAAPAHPAALRLWPGRRPHLLRDAARGRRIAAPAAGTREAAAVGNSDRDHARGCERPRLRPPPRRDPPGYQARKHPVPGRTGGRRRFRNRTRAERGGGLALDGDGAVPRHAAIYEPRAGNRRPRAGRAQRHLLARRRALRDARGRAAPHRPHRPVGDRQGLDGPSSCVADAARCGAAAPRSRDSEGAREGAGGPVRVGGTVRRGVDAPHGVIPGAGGPDRGRAAAARTRPSGGAVGTCRPRHRRRGLGVVAGPRHAPCPAGGALLPRLPAGVPAPRLPWVVARSLARRVAHCLRWQRLARRDVALLARTRAPRPGADSRYAERQATVLLSRRPVDRVLAGRPAAQAVHLGWGGRDDLRSDERRRSGVGGGRRDRVCGLGSPVPRGRSGWKARARSHPGYCTRSSLSVARVPAGRSRPAVHAPRRLRTQPRGAVARRPPRPTARPDGVEPALRAGGSPRVRPKRRHAVWRPVRSPPRALLRPSGAGRGGYPCRAALRRQVRVVPDGRARVPVRQHAAAPDGDRGSNRSRAGAARATRSLPRPQVFTRRQTHRDIWIAPVDSPQGARPLLRTPFDERGIALSPDGRWLAYASNETGNDEVYVRRLLEGSARWRVSMRGGTEPRWGRGGRELYFRNGDSLYAVAMQLGAELRAGPPRALFGGKYQAAVAGNNISYNVSPDGGRFLMVGQLGNGREELSVVLHWFDQIRRRGAGTAVAVP